MTKQLSAKELFILRKKLSDLLTPLFDDYKSKKQPHFSMIGTVTTHFSNGIYKLYELASQRAAEEIEEALK